MVQPVKEDLYALDVKKLILRRPQLFGNLGKSQVLFEKAITRHSVVADALIFSTNLGVIGIEIKTARDSTKRLNKQLNAYKRVCDFVYVFCHDSQIARVEKVLDEHHHPNVGLFSYSEYNGEQIVGKLRDSNTSPEYSVYDLLDILWKDELRSMANSLTSGFNVEDDEFKQSMKDAQYAGRKKQSRKKQANGGSSLMIGHQLSISKSLNKPAIIRYIIDLLGLMGAKQLMVDMIVAKVKSPEKVLKFYHFKGGQ